MSIFTGLSSIIDHHGKEHQDNSYFGDYTTSYPDGSYITRCQFCNFKVVNGKMAEEDDARIGNINTSNRGI